MSLTDLSALMPAWAPTWLPLLLAIPAVLFVLAFLAMPFSVFGLRGRLDGIEARLDEIQSEIRALSLRLPGAAAGAGRGVDAGELYTGRPIARSAPPSDPPARPPIPPAPGDAGWDAGWVGGSPAPRAERPLHSGRVEPRLRDER